MKANGQLVREWNLNILRKIMQQRSTATKPELAVQSGLSVVTVNSLITDMLMSGEARENGTVPSGGGRPSMQYSYNYDYQCTVIIYGYQREKRNYIHTLTVNLAGDCCFRHEDYYDRISVTSFDGILDRLFEQFPSIIQIVFGLPGEAVNDVITINDFREIEGPEFLAHYKERYEVSVVFENDINAMTYGHFVRSKEAVQSVVGIYFPRSFLPGAGLILDGRIYYGAGHFAGEMGNIPVPIPWEELDYEDEAQILTTMEYLLVVFSSIVAPSCFVLYGDFFTDTIADALKQYAEKRLDHRFSITLSVALDMTRDYEAGLIRLALEGLEVQMPDTHRETADRTGG